jgi:hypothetical protein
MMKEHSYVLKINVTLTGKCSYAKNLSCRKHFLTFYSVYFLGNLLMDWI